MSIEYVIVTPARNEEAFIERTIESVAAQTIPPARWILVDDGSTDGTRRLMEEGARRYPWIRTVARPDRGDRRAGGGVMEAFYAGFNLLDGQGWDYLVKLDGDVTFDAHYFEKCFAHFAAEPKLGVASGSVCAQVNGTLCLEAKGDPPFHVRGASKIYRRKCWQAIGGLIQATGWDTVDELKANMLGWTTRTFPDIQLIHHRPTGAAYGAWSNWLKNGRANYMTGYHPLFMLVKCASRLVKRPYGIAALGLWVGFCGEYLKRRPQVPDAEVIRYLRREQMKRLFFRRSLWDTSA